MCAVMCSAAAASLSVMCSAAAASLSVLCSAAAASLSVRYYLSVTLLIYNYMSTDNYYFLCMHVKKSIIQATLCTCYRVVYQ